MRLALVPLALLLPAPALAADLVLQERVPLAFVLITPTGEVGQTRSSELIRILSEELEHRTNFALSFLEPETVEECRGRLMCLVTKSRPDYSPEELRRSDGTFGPYREHLERLAERKQTVPEFLLVIANVTRPGEPDRLRAQVVDTHAALEAYHEAPRDQAGWEARLEASINETAFSPARGEVQNTEDARGWVRGMLGQLAPLFEQNGNWDPYGALELHGVDAGAAVLLDGVTVGTTRDGTTRIERVTPGDRRVGVQLAGHEPFEAAVRVARGKTEVVRPELRVASTGGGLASGMVWGGAAAALAGAALVGWAVVRHDSAVTSRCFEGAPGCAPGRAFESGGYDPEQGVNPPGLLIAPLGFALAGTGAAWIFGPDLLDQQPAWVSLLAGVAVGGAVYAVSALAASPGAPP